MLAELTIKAALPDRRALEASDHLLVLGPKGASEATLPGGDRLRAALRRRRKKPGDLAKTPLSAETGAGGLMVFAAPDLKAPVFEQQTVLRQAAMALLSEKPDTLTIAVTGSFAERRALARLAMYVVWVNGIALPERKRQRAARALKRVTLYGVSRDLPLDDIRAVAEGNALCRTLTLQPPNELTPGRYRREVANLARRHGWSREEFSFNRLKTLGAGAFCAVAQGSDEKDAAIVRLRYRPRGAKKTIALVGKGICFDTGGHNLKPARYMAGMHEDMNGSAVVLGALLAATRAGLKVNIDCWLALAQNHLSPRAYKQNDVVTALDGTTIEVVHTDAEGRMVLADTLTLAARTKPDLIVDFATLTGSMHVALGTRYSGVFASEPSWLERVLAAGTASGERVCVFPMDDDYDSALDSDIADVKQCTLDGEADHILAARLLQRFTNKRPWIHVDLSAHNCKGGLGAVASTCTGFGVAWCDQLLRGIIVQ